jgi:hypothetical protein
MSVRKITAAEEIKVYIFVYLHRNVIYMVSTATHRIRGIRLMLIVMLLVRNPSHLIPYLPVIFYLLPYYGPLILKVFRIMNLNLKRFLAYYRKIILMPEILMGSNSCREDS